MAHLTGSRSVSSAVLNLDAKFQIGQKARRKFPTMLARTLIEFQE
jgi:hypothetical protein